MLKNNSTKCSRSIIEKLALILIGKQLTLLKGKRVKNNKTKIKILMINKCIIKKPTKY